MCYQHLVASVSIFIIIRLQLQIHNVFCDAPYKPIDCRKYTLIIKVNGRTTEGVVLLITVLESKE